MPVQTNVPSTTTADTSTDHFVDAVRTQHKRGGGLTAGTPLVVLGVLLMVGGVVGAFVQYSATLSYDDTRDIASAQVLTLAFIGLSIIGSAFFVAGSVGRVLRLWLLRQVLESRQRDELFLGTRREN